MSSLPPTVVLVHGAFVDAASWAPVAGRLLASGHDVLVPGLSGRSLLADAEYLRAVVEQVDRPVLLVGHGYGGAVSTVAGVAENVVGLVLVAAPVLDEDECLGALGPCFDESAASFLHARHRPVEADVDGTDLFVARTAFADVVAGGLPRDVAAVLAVSQRPLGAEVLGELATAAAWRTTPTWGVVATADRLVPPALARSGLRGAGARRVVDVDAGHLVPLSHPDLVAGVVRDALTDLTRSPAAADRRQHHTHRRTHAVHHHP